MKRTIFEPEHELFRQTARGFYLKECAPHVDEWEETGRTPREPWLVAGRLGLIGWEAPVEFGGLGVRDFRYNAVMTEELHATGSASIGIGLQNDILSSYMVHLTNDEQKKRWLPGFVSGELIAAIAMSEPGAGSDIAGIRTTACREGDHYVINGAKTFISSGLQSDLIVTVVKTDPAAGRKGISLLAIERGMEGFERGRKLDKIGQRSADTAELSFSDVRVPVENLIGEENRGFYHLMRNLPAERLGIAIQAASQARRALEITTEYAADRKAFGQAIGTFQVNRHAIAEMTVKLDVMQVYVDRCIEASNAGELTAQEAAGAKYWATETQWEILDRCLQLHGGYGYMNEYEIARLWRDARVQRMYGGTNEIMKDLIGRSLGF
ncbi:long-chain-acyl-CoA dehydrogenase [Pseudonocardia sulfidoxydans NBRC 16205]|uniref:Long-chain-acyl-CoA dehydrogenase n=1 Tax=Pseudonocardia sulfidoxydans NBRC 16205 TaxID=1223511 RepID=A0A511DQ75_9PSEU|nr:acyl-CoA dehydrogenase family protein [Pseudonocardia sulfidoxydans]GEL26393.1 long-chain-acyl-CoA dehydrogenase [Pseudonocardia sulfidoxydans NBRC 16205]